MTLLGVSYKVV